ncbi:hypothetical protein F5X96DRAFT_499171 [Biscogniauxia mediterranea]|nr:hypothetical protein F5X96DRAFT_499171 [Biscogniauxia mediterranea]
METRALFLASPWLMTPSFFLPPPPPPLGSCANARNTTQLNATLELVRTSYADHHQGITTHAFTYVQITTTTDPAPFSRSLPYLAIDISIFLFLLYIASHYLSLPVHLSPPVDIGTCCN